MTIKNGQLILLITLIGCISNSCVETFDFETEVETFESALVIEATITNEQKLQEILLSRTFALDEDGPSPENNANVKVIDGVQNEYLFHETDPGVYISNTAFSVQPNRSYTLQIITNNGRSYASEVMQLTQSTQMDSLYVVRDLNENDEEGLSIYIDSFDPNNSSKYYRFEYEEAYKIIAPFWVPSDLTFGTPPDEPQFILVPRPIEERICYNVVKSNTIIITNTLDLLEDRLDKYRIRFLNRNNYIISHRYTILVKQYIQSRETHNYYEVLKNLSESESLFSESQVGFIQGNVFSLNQKNEKVLGYFEMSAVDTKRIYFNYEDLFPEKELPPYAISCNNLVTPPVTNPAPSGSLCPLCDFIEDGNWKYLGENASFDSNDPYSGPYVLIPRTCGDCTVLGSSDPPAFWIE